MCNSAYQYHAPALVRYPARFPGKNCSPVGAQVLATWACSFQAGTPWALWSTGREKIFLPEAQRTNTVPWRSLPKPEYRNACATEENPSLSKTNELEFDYTR